MSDSYAVGSLFAFLANIFLILFIVAIGFWLLSAFAMKRLFTAYEYENPNYAFIPFVGTYLLFKLSVQHLDEIKVWGITVPRGIYEFSWLITGFLAIIPILGFLLSIVASIAFTGTMIQHVYSFIDNKDFKDCLGMSILSIFVPLVFAIKLLTFDMENVNQYEDEIF